MNTVLGILAKGDMNCAGEETPDNADLFSADKQSKPSAKPADLHQPPRSASEMEPGVVPTAAEKAAIEEQRRKAAEEAAKREAEEAARRAQEEAEQAKRNAGYAAGQAKGAKETAENAIDIANDASTRVSSTPATVSSPSSTVTAPAHSGNPVSQSVASANFINGMTTQESCFPYIYYIQLDKIEWKVNAIKNSEGAVSTTGGATLNADQYIQIKNMKATIKGLSINLN